MHLTNSYHMLMYAAFWFEFLKILLLCIQHTYFAIHFLIIQHEDNNFCHYLCIVI